MLDEQLSTLPRLQLFVPFSEHRRTWRGTADLIIGSTADRHHTPVLTAFDSDGAKVMLRRSDGVPSRSLAILIQAEPISRRVDPQKGMTGDVIQDADDGQEGGVISMTDALGVTRTYELADLPAAGRSLSKSVGDAPVASPYLVPCDVDCGGSGQVNPPAKQDTIYVRAFVIFWQDGEWAGHEVQINADLYFTTLSTTPDMHSHYRRDGVEACDRATPPSAATCVAWQSQEPGVPLFLIPGGAGFAKIDLNTFEMNVIQNDWHGFTEYTTSTIGTWRPMCTATCPPEDGDMYLKRTYHF
jgi:hypothetical protein